MKTKYLLFSFVLSSILIILGCKERPINSASNNEMSTLIVDSLYSESLQEYRYFNIYLPAGYSKEKKLPVVYMADGQFLAQESDLYKSGLDALFGKENTRKAVIFGINSKTNLLEEGNPISFRHYEYMSALKGMKDEEDDRLENWYLNHLTFFTKEAFLFAESKYGVSKQREDRAFYGASNGGGYGITLGVEFPELFKYLVCHSPAAEVYNELNWDITQYSPPIFYLAYGDTNDFSAPSLKLDSLLTAKNYKHELVKYKGGHDTEIWRELMFQTFEEILSLEKK